MAFRCDRCNKAFLTRHAKQEHELIHLNIRIQCDQCEKDFSNHSNLLRHKNQYHSKTYQSSKVGTLYSTDGSQLFCGECGSVYGVGESDKYLKHIGKHLKK